MAKGKKENKPKSKPRKEAIGDVLGPRKPAKSMKKQSKKEPMKKSEEPAPSIVPSFLPAEEEEPAFPRGGKSLLSREEEAEARAEAEEEFMREMKGGHKSNQGKNKKKKKDKGRLPSSLQEPEEAWGSLFGETIGGKLPRFANRITLKNISPHMKLLGIVVEVNAKDLVISLPGGLRGFVRSEDAMDIIPRDASKDSESSFLSRNFHVGQLVPCIVLQIDEDKREGKVNKRVWLSLRLSLVQKNLSLDVLQIGMALIAQVKSIEDHGYILHFGTPSISGFLPQISGDNIQSLKKGQLLQGVIKNIDQARGIVIMNSEPELVANSVLQDLKGLSIDQLLPGMMVNAQVHATLENGIMLSFLTYFKGTVDVFHLRNSLSDASWKEEYPQHKKINGRILFIDPSTRAVGLTLNRHLILNRAPPCYVKTGDIYDNAKIIRVDAGVGLLLEIPSTPASSTAYIFEAIDEAQKLTKKYKEGALVRVRLLGIKNVEGLAVGTMKAAAFEGSVFTHSDVKPGMLVKAKVLAVESFGAIVQFSSGVKALCPLPHMSEFEIVKPSKKFQIGSELVFRVLGCKSKRITVTFKKTLVKSKLPVIASYADASDGLITHGWITNIEGHGCFVKFYNGVQGFAHRSELGLEPGVEPTAAYHIGQVMKCRVISSSAVSRRISISFVLSLKRDSHDLSAKPGSVVSGVVERLTPASVIVNVKAGGYLKGTIYNEHLSDYRGHASLMKSLLKPGYEFEELLVLDSSDTSNLILSAKDSFIKCSMELPSECALVRPDAVIHGYVCNVIETGCFVRFLGRLTGFCSKNKVSDKPVSDPLDIFYVGQSVRSYVIKVDSDRERIMLSLKHSSCRSTDPSFLQNYFLTEKKIASLHAPESSNSALIAGDDFIIGTVVKGEVQELKEYGVVLGFKDRDTVGFVSQYQLGGRVLEIGSRVKAFVLDVSLPDNLVDLSLKEDFLNKGDGKISENVSSKKKRRRDASSDLNLNQTVTGIVEIVKENYLVLSLPECEHAIGFASVIDYNTQKVHHSGFVHGQRIQASVAALPCPSTLGRLLLLLEPTDDIIEAPCKKGKKESMYSAGSLVDAEIAEIKALEVHLTFGGHCRGRVHITEVFDGNASSENPLKSLKAGQRVRARIIGKHKHGKGDHWEMSLRPSLLEEGKELPLPSAAEEPKYSVGDLVTGYVVKIEDEWLRLTISRQFMAKMFILDTSFEPDELVEFEKRYPVGQPVTGRVLTVNEPKKLLCLASHLSKNSESAEHIHQGDVVGGRIKKILPGVGGLLVQIGPHLCGRVHYTELCDQWVSDPVSVYKEGQFVKCKVLEISRVMSVHVDLSLRPSLYGQDKSDSDCKRFSDASELQPDMTVQGYIKGVTPKGCFVTLSRKVDARILISDLSDGFVEKPELEFPVGRLIKGRVLAVDSSSKRVDLTLKSEDGAKTSSGTADFSNLHIGDVISGKIKRIEPYGLFITIANSNTVGLCHVSQLPHTNSEDIRTKYVVGEDVSAKILKMDPKRRRLSLGMKNVEPGSLEDERETGSNNKDQSISSITAVDKYENCSNDLLPWPEELQSRAAVPALEVALEEESDVSDVDNGPIGVLEAASSQSLDSKRSKKQMKKREKEEREAEICAAEERRLLQDVPRTEDEFERLVRSSPNSSFLWIKYMAFLLSLADVEKARSIAERALKAINFREEDEKLNIWVAYFNLENEYGNPPEDAVKKTFQRALQYCDPKKLHLALLGLYERTDQHKLADELLEKMGKKFKSSCKVWIHRLQSYLRQKKEGIQSVVNQALLSLPRKKHIKFISQAAIQEFKLGEPDRGRSMLEGVLREYPKRIDLWSVYLDQEIRMGDVEVIRSLFERATCLSLPPKKMKFLFKKYLQFEKSQDSEGERVEYVKKKALEYVESSQV
ncbi:RIBOSOMAL RNA PROCESSING 5 [Wolffia australiana]